MEQRKSILMSEKSIELNKNNANDPFRNSMGADSDLEMDLEGLEDPFGKDWSQLQAELKSKSLYHDFDTYKLRYFIFKSNDDLRQELLAVQLIKRLK